MYIIIFIYFILIQTTLQMEEIQSKKQQVDRQISVKLYIYGSCQSDQYYHPTQQSQSRRPICLSDLASFQIKNQNNDKSQIIPNPLLKLSINKIACGALHTIITSTEGKVFTFGCNDQGALGRGGIQKIPVEVKLNNSIIDLISAGDNHSIFASSGQGSVYFAGNYKFLRGESMTTSIRQPVRFDINEITNRSNPQSSLKKVVSGCNHTAIQVGNRVYVRGQPEAHTVGRRINARRKIQSSLTFQGVGFSNVEDVWCGGYHNIIKIHNSKHKRFEYFGWGENKRGQLGLNHYKDVSYPVQIKKLRGKDVLEVAAGTNFTIFLTKQGQLYGCGQNSYGQLGLGEDYEYINSQQSQSQKEDQQKHEKPQQKLEKPQVQNGQNGQKKQCLLEVEKKQNINLENQSENVNDHEKKQASIEDPKSPVKHLQQSNIYIKTLKKIDLQQKIQHINAGSQFAFGWNEKNLYSWGFGSNYVLLNGQQQDELIPFRVKPKILQEKSIYQLSSGSQHVAFLSFSKQSDKKPNNELLESFKKLAIQSRKKLSRRGKKKNS